MNHTAAMLVCAVAALGVGYASAQSPRPVPPKPPSGSIDTSFIDAGAIRATFIDAGTLNVGGTVTMGANLYTNGHHFLHGQLIGEDLAQFTGSFPRDLGTHTIYVSTILYNGIMVGGAITSTLDDTSMVYESRAGNQNAAAGHIFTSTHMRDAGSLFRINSGYPCDRPVFDVGPDGNLIVAAPPNPNCAEAANINERGIITDGTASSGHPLTQSYDALYWTARSRLGNATHAIEVDGGRPVCDGGIYCTTWPDGGTNLPYGGHHGAFTFGALPGLVSAGLLEFINPNGIGGSSKFFMGPEGQLNNCHSLTFAQLPACPGWSYDALYDGTLYHYAYGAGVGDIVCAEAAGVPSYYLCTPSGWMKFTVGAP